MNNFAIDTAKAADRDELLDLLLRAFKTRSPDHLPFDILYPDVFDPTDEAMGHHYIIRENGRITACVGSYPLDLQLGPVKLRVAGIGQVACDVELRRGGRVTALLNHAISHMRDTLGCPLSWLGGRRDFYAKFGWERSGSILLVDIDSQSLKHEPEDGWTVRQLDPTQQTVDLLWDLRNRQPVRHIVTKRNWLLKLQRLGTEVWCAFHDGAATLGAFAVANRERKQLSEYTGTYTGIEAILAELTKRHSNLQMQLAPGLDPDTEFFWDRSVRPGAVMSNMLILDLPALLGAYAPVIEPKLPPNAGVELVMTPWQSADIATARLGTGVARLELDPLRMARMVFGPAAPSALLQLPRELLWLDQIFPLPFRIPLNSYL